MSGSARARTAASHLLVACWVIPGAAISFLALAGPAGFGLFTWLRPALTNGLVVGTLVVLILVYALFWLSLPITLLVVGLGQLRFVSPADLRWPVLWAGAVLNGVALDVLVVRALDPNAPVSVGHREWLVAAVGYLAVGAVMIVILQAARRTLPGSAP